MTNKITIFLIFWFSINAFADQKDFKKIAAGIYLTELKLDDGNSNLIVLKCEANHALINFSYSNDNSLNAKDVVISKKLLAGINVNYFDKLGEVLGLVYRKPSILNRIHLGGNVLTGLVEIKLNKDLTFEKINILSKESEVFGDLALQAGPRLIVATEATRIKDKSYSRRSGICVDKNDSIFIFETKDGYPGTTFKALQNILLNIGCVNAINFDGGGSAQFYLAPHGDLKEEIWVGGNQNVPVVLTVSLP